MNKTDYQEIGEEYIKIAKTADLLIGEGNVVDAYFGDPKIIQKVTKQEPDLLLTRIDNLLNRVDSGVDDKAPNYSKTMLKCQLNALRMQVEIYKGTKYSYKEAVECMTGLELDEPKTAGEHKRNFDELLQKVGYIQGNLEERHHNWEKSGKIDIELYVKKAEGMIDQYYDMTKKFLLKYLPKGEVKLAAKKTDASWEGYNFYKGKYAGEVWFNTKYEHYEYDLPAVVSHEAYPGHQASNISREYYYNKGKLGVESTIFLINTPECSIAEGIGDNAPYFLKKWVIINDNVRIALALRQLEMDCILTGALKMHVKGESRAEVKSYLIKNAFLSEKIAERRSRFIEEWKYYTPNYRLGWDFVNKFYTKYGDNAIKHLYRWHCPATLRKALA